MSKFGVVYGQLSILFAHFWETFGQIQGPRNIKHFYMAVYK
jgi:hypothetical protein